MLYWTDLMRSSCQRCLPRRVRRISGGYCFWWTTTAVPPGQRCSPKRLFFCLSCKTKLTLNVTSKEWHTPIKEALSCTYSKPQKVQSGLTILYIMEQFREKKSLRKNSTTLLLEMETCSTTLQNKKTYCMISWALSLISIVAMKVFPDPVGR